MSLIPETILEPVDVLSREILEAAQARAKALTDSGAWRQIRHGEFMNPALGDMTCWSDGVLTPVVAYSRYSADWHYPVLRPALERASEPEYVGPKHESKKQPGLFYWAQREKKGSGGWIVTAQATGFAATEAHDDWFANFADADQVAEALANETSSASQTT